MKQQHLADDALASRTCMSGVNGFTRAALHHSLVSSRVWSQKARNVLSYFLSKRAAVQDGRRARVGQLYMSLTTLANV